MNIKLRDNAYLKLREHDSSFQAMSRIVDTSNIYDVRQTFIRNMSSGINDFTKNFKLWSNNAGILSDGKHTNKRDFFIDTSVLTDIYGNKSVVTKKIKYFKFKTNAKMSIKSLVKLNKCVIIKTTHQSIYEMNTRIDAEGNVTYFEDIHSPNANKDLESDAYGKVVTESDISSYPLVRNDKLMINELPALFVYLNGIKLPDNEIFIYPSNSGADVLVPMKYLGDIEGTKNDVNFTFNIDVRQEGTEDFYYRNNKFTGSFINLDLSENDFHYDRYNANTVTKDKIVLFVDGKIQSVESVQYASLDDKKNIRIDFQQNYQNKDIEIYILNDIVYRHTAPTETMINSIGNKVHFYINDDYITDVISGPITKNSISFFYKGMRIDDSKITQTSRFSFEYDIDVANFDETKIDFFIEDMNRVIADNKYRTYSDDYYLLNMLGVKRCVDKMKGSSSFSIFDQPENSISFKSVLSKSGMQFDVPKTIEYYDNLEKFYKNDKERIHKLLTDKPSIIRPFIEQNFSTPSKKILVVGNSNDVMMTSVENYDNETKLIFYKIYLNHKLLDTSSYSVEYKKDKDFLRIPKELLTIGQNRIELFQYDLTYSENSIFSDFITNGFVEVINSEDEPVWQRYYSFAELPFDNNFLSDDICAIEQVKKEWYSDTEPEFHLVYPNKNDNIGYRSTKYFKIINRTDAGMTVQIKLNNESSYHTNGRFFMLMKSFNMIEQIVYSNVDSSYMTENDLLFPVHTTYTEYNYKEVLDDLGRTILVKDGVKEIFDYIPYINSSEPLIARNGEELIYGKEYTFINPDKSENVAGSFIILKTQTRENDIIACQFNSTKSNILILGYTDLEIDNKYGLIYLSELKYPVSPEYMNIIVNGHKLSKYDIDILSDKLIRVRNINRPIKTLLITTSIVYKQSEIQNYLDNYKESNFEKILESIFTNCDPCKLKNPSKPSVNVVYKVDPIEFPDIYVYNHGFDPMVDSILQAENPLEDSSDIVYTTDTLRIMFINWFNNSGKTRSVCHPEKDLAEFVLRYFSIFENIIIDNRLDIFIDSGTVYDGVPENICNDIIRRDIDTVTEYLSYPGANDMIRRRVFFAMLKDVVSDNMLNAELGNGECLEPVNWVKRIQKHPGSNILYAEDFPLKPDMDGIIYTGYDYDITLYNND